LKLCRSTPPHPESTARKVGGQRGHGKIAACAANIREIRQIKDNPLIRIQKNSFDCSELEKSRSAIGKSLPVDCSRSLRAGLPADLARLKECAHVNDREYAQGASPGPRKVGTRHSDNRRSDLARDAGPALLFQNHSKCITVGESVDGGRFVPNSVVLLADDLTGALDAAPPFAGLVTGPISEEALHLAGYPNTGHTELLESSPAATRPA